MSILGKITLTSHSLKIVRMGSKREFEIAFVGLKPGVHEFNYELDDKFFIDHGCNDLKNVNVNVKLTLEKNSGFMRLKFDIGGKADALCDRCGNPLSLDLWDEFNMIVKLVENPEEMNEQEEDPDIHYISRTESHLEVGDWIYEFVMLSMPMQRICPEDEKGKSTCNADVLKMLDKMQQESDGNAGTLWKGLDKFKEN